MSASGEQGRTGGGLGGCLVWCFWCCTAIVQATVLAGLCCIHARHCGKSVLTLHPDLVADLSFVMSHPLRAAP